MAQFVYHIGDMLHCAKALDGKVLLHVFASHKRFGGGWRNHQNAQEEYLFNQTALRFNQPPPNSYPIDGLNGRTGFILDVENLSYAFVPAPVQGKSTEWSLDARAHRLAEFAKEYDHVVTGAWGCGVFHNAPSSIAHALKTAFATYDGKLHLCFLDSTMMSKFQSITTG